MSDTMYIDALRRSGGQSDHGFLFFWNSASNAALNESFDPERVTVGRFKAPAEGLLPTPDEIAPEDPLESKGSSEGKRP